MIKHSKIGPGSYRLPQEKNTKKYVMGQKIVYKDKTFNLLGKYNVEIEKKGP